MPARIFRPTRSAMQSGNAKTKVWVFEYDPEVPRTIEPLMGWTSSSDMRSQIRLMFESKEEAIAYAEKNGIPYRVEETVAAARKTISYADNFKFDRTGPWTH